MDKQKQVKYKWRKLRTGIFLPIACSLLGVMLTGQSVQAEDWTANSVEQVKNQLGDIPKNGGEYVIKKGDTLWAISQATDLTIDSLLSLNEYIEDANLIFTGNTLHFGKKTITRTEHGTVEQQTITTTSTSDDCVSATVETVKDKNGEIVSQKVTIQENGEQTNTDSSVDKNQSDKLETKTTDYTSGQKNGTATANNTGDKNVKPVEENGDKSNEDTKPSDNSGDKSDAETKPSDNAGDKSDTNTNPSDNAGDKSDTDTKPSDNTGDKSNEETKPSDKSDEDKSDKENTDKKDDVSTDTKPAEENKDDKTIVIDTPADETVEDIIVPEIPKSDDEEVIKDVSRDDVKSEDINTDTAVTEKTEDVKKVTPVFVEPTVIYDNTLSGGEKVVEPGTDGQKTEVVEKTTDANGNVVETVKEVVETPATPDVVRVGIDKTDEDETGKTETIGDTSQTENLTRNERVVTEEVPFEGYFMVDDKTRYVGEEVITEPSKAGSRTVQIVEMLDANGNVVSSTRTVIKYVSPKFGVKMVGVRQPDAGPVEEVLSRRETREFNSDIVPFDVRYVNDGDMMTSAEPIVEVPGVDGYTKNTQVVEIDATGTETVISTDQEVVAPVEAVVRRGTKTEEDVKKETEYVRVTFLGRYDEVLSEKIIEKGTKANPPAVLNYFDAEFIHWSTDYSNVQDNLTVKAVYEVLDEKYLALPIEQREEAIRRDREAAEAEAKEQEQNAEIVPAKEPVRMVEYRNADDSLVAVHEIKDGQAETPVTPTVEGKDFVAWGTKDGHPVDLSATTEDTVALYPIFKDKVYTVTFKADGQTIATQNVAHGQSADLSAVTAPEKDGFKFKAWSASTNNVTGDLEVSAEYVENTKYLVKFIGEDGQVIATETVSEGKGARIPAAPKVVGKTFKGWSEATNKVTSDMTVRAEYTVNQHKVTFVADGKEIKSETVDYGTSATAPFAPAKANHKFTGWSTSFDKVTNDLRVVAQYESTEITVTFKVNGKTIIKKVNKGETVDFPTPTPREGYTFAKWSVSGTSFQEDATIVAMYVQNTYSVTFVADGKTVLTQTVLHGQSATAPSAPVKAGHKFVKWDKSYNEITGNTTVTAVYERVYGNVSVTFKAVDQNGIGIKTIGSKQYTDSSTIQSKDFINPPAIDGYTFAGWTVQEATAAQGLTITARYTQNKYNVVIQNDRGVTVQNLTRTHNQTVTPSASTYSKTGYTLTHFVDQDGKNVGLSDIRITKDTVLKPVYTINTYTVKFHDANKNVIKTQTVEYGKSASAPVAPSVSGKKFSRWSHDTSRITTDLNVYAEYQDVTPAGKAVTIKYQVVDPTRGRTFNLGTAEGVEGGNYTAKAPKDLSALGSTATNRNMFGLWQIGGWDKVSEANGTVVMQARLVPIDGWQLAEPENFGVTGFLKPADQGATPEYRRDTQLAYRFRDDLAQDFLREVNAYRASTGKSTYEMTTATAVDQKVHELTKERAEQLMYYFSHNLPDGSGSSAKFFAGSGVQNFNENIAYNTILLKPKTAKETLDQFLRSPGHKATIVANGYAKTSIHVIETKEGLYWIQVFYS